jgi:hypothetical protein
MQIKMPKLIEAQSGSRNFQRKVVNAIQRTTNKEMFTLHALLDETIINTLPHTCCIAIGTEGVLW